MKVWTCEIDPMNVRTNVQTSERSSYNSQHREVLEAHEDILKSSSSPLSNASILTAFEPLNQELCLDYLRLLKTSIV